VTFAKRVFTIAAIFGVAALAPLYFLEDYFGRIDPPPINQPAYYYGFVGVALVWQLAYYTCGRDPVRYRPFMLLSAAAKASWALAALVLFIAGRCSEMLFASSLPDALFAVLFVIAYLKTPST
jgi:hypothetical protein